MSQNIKESQSSIANDLMWSLFHLFSMIIYFLVYTLIYEEEFSIILSILRAKQQDWSLYEKDQTKIVSS